MRWRGSRSGWLPAITTKPDFTIPEAAEKMIEHDISTLVVTENDEIKGVLTRYDLIEIIASFREKEEVYVQVSGVEGTPEVYHQMYDLIQNFLEKINKVLKPLVLN
ncbi:MAG: CBS domain-containing protein, partial [Trueperaceae bacterium]